MATNHFIKQAFGNHNMLQQYLNHLREPEKLPPFLPVLYRSVGHGVEDEDIIRENELLKYKAINKLIKHELKNQFAVYQQLKIPASAE
jgi:hypothetical protein